jgi:hypothetical protein
MSAPGFKFESRTKSGEQKSKFICTERGSRGSTFRTSERFIGVTEEAFVELSGGLVKLSPLIFQSD